MNNLNLAKRLGIIRSFFMYYLKPFNEQRLIRFYQPFVNPGDLCFDIGAHLGNRSNAWLKMGAKVVAVEPQPACISFLSKKFGSSTNFSLIEKAVGDKVGKSIMKISSLYPTISTISSSWQFSNRLKAEDLTYWDDQVEVELTTLDELISKYGMPRFCKIDVEDFELEVLKGLNQPIPALSFEFLPAKISKAAACIDRLTKLGNYEYNLSFKEYLRFERNKWLSPSEMKIVLLHHDREISGDIYARLTMQEEQA